MTKQESVVKKLQEKGFHISFAESCTAGLACGALVDVASASSVLDASFVTYANEAKIALVGVKPETLDTFGAVSEQTAGEMASGCAAAAHAQIGVGISGIAGPGGGTPEKPVGTVCFGFYINGRLYTERMQFGKTQTRAAIRDAAVRHVFDRLDELL